ncbi:MAG: hypothetical protein ACQEXJ_00815 [Myxococcota bacterium]
MDERMSRDGFFRRYDRFRLRGRPLRSLVAAALLAAVLLGGTGTMVWATATGVFFPRLEPVPRVGHGHVVRSHGWGGYYIGAGAGRRHFGGGGRIH